MKLNNESTILKSLVLKFLSPITSWPELSRPLNFSEGSLVVFANSLTNSWPYSMSCCCVLAPTNNSLGSKFSRSESISGDVLEPKSCVCHLALFRRPSWHSRCLESSLTGNSRFSVVWFLISWSHLSISDLFRYLFWKISRWSAHLLWYSFQYDIETGDTATKWSFPISSVSVECFSLRSSFRLLIFNYQKGITLR